MFSVKSCGAVRKRWWRPEAAPDPDDEDMKGMEDGEDEA